MPVTQKDIAQHTGLSRSTVVHALNGTGDIKAETRDKVLKAAKELGYRPNFLAQALVTGKTNTIALWYSPSIDHVIMGLVNRIDRQILPFKLMLTNVSNRNRGAGLPDEFPAAEWPVDGIIAISIGEIPDWLLEEGKLNKPFVSLVYDAFPYRPGPEIDTILVKLQPACESAMEYLVRTRKRIAMLCVQSMPKYGDLRVRAYEAAIQAAGRQPEYILHRLLSPLREHARQAVIDHVKEHGCPDAIFCGNDDQAIAANIALQQMGYRVPRDVAIIGNDGLEEMEYHSPSLSTIALPLDDMAQLAWKFLQKRLAEPQAPRQYAEINATLLLRASSQVLEQQGAEEKQ